MQVTLKMNHVGPRVCGGDGDGDGDGNGDGDGDVRKDDLILESRIGGIKGHKLLREPPRIHAPTANISIDDDMFPSCIMMKETKHPKERLVMGW